MEQASASHNANVMSLLHTQNQWIEFLEAECNHLCTMFLAQYIYSLSLALNNVEYIHSQHASQAKEDIMQQSEELMEINEPKPPLYEK